MTDAELAAVTKQAITIGAMQKYVELYTLLSIVQKEFSQPIGDTPARTQGCPRATIVEIGTDRGGTFYGLCQVAPEDAHLYSIDLPAGNFGSGYEYHEADAEVLHGWRKPGQQTYLLRGDSHDPAIREALVASLAGAPIDFLLIDGDHTYVGVKTDWEMYSPLVREGGLVVFHDICHHLVFPNCKVDRFWGEIEDKFDSRRVIDPNDTTLGGFGLLRTGPKKPLAEKRGLLLDIGRGDPQPGFVRGAFDVESFPWPIEEESVHLLVGAGVIEHLRPWNVWAFFDEAWRVLAPGGQMALATPYAGSANWWADPSHSVGFNERSFAYLDPEHEAWAIHRPRPWRCGRGNPVWKCDGNLEVILFPLK